MGIFGSAIVGTLLGVFAYFVIIALIKYIKEG
jgi:hypothetical protein